MIECEVKCKKCLKQIPVDSEGKSMAKNGLCLECYNDELKAQSIDWMEKEQELQEKIEEVRRAKGTFDGLVMLSGGKDSIYVAYILSKVYKLNIVGLTIDNGFEYQSTFDNSYDIAKKLGISHFIYRLPFEDMREYYNFLLTEDTLKLQDCSQLCFFCGRLLKTISIKVAKMLNVTAVFSGHTLEQIRALGDEEGKDKSFDIRRRYIQNYSVQNYKKALDLLKEKSKESISYLFDDNLETLNFDRFIYPLQYFEYKPIEIVELLSKELGWVADTHFTKKYISSGCKLGKLMEYIATKNGSTTYVEREFSDQIRRGSLSKEDVIKIIESRVDDEGEIQEIIDLLSTSKEKLFWVGEK
ncbi:hypothetical protein [Ruminiclostridium cellulolyticum]|uniref:PP-loop domain protein n=1 Tax=Ruminiclostridium cellulolyticum (strain ATCC 35319 / DSM 5812 / JCM 6584 / H10) TaxID=394503 RepID=B8I0Z1_RUMCH|nr:hypothetical protein [Ruminiclostridium cellulolyticum]ACL77547.1 conserved hypothetical protein [Ruminiclostridium cellulolyticum H10]